MPIPIDPMIEIMQTALLQKLGQEVELVFQYGSHVRGNTHKYSDIDLSFVPVHENTWESITVMVGETLLDFYPMHWSKLESMAGFLDPSYTVLLENRITYRREEAAQKRFLALADRLRGLFEPSARPVMLRKALEIFQRTAWPFYLLRQAAADGNPGGCLIHAQDILRHTFHCLAACNQAAIDTRKTAQVFALPKLPADFNQTVEGITTCSDPLELPVSCEGLLEATRAFLLAEQRQVLHRETTFTEAFEAAYPELKRDLQGVLLGCERQEAFSLRSSLLSLYHEMNRILALARNGVDSIAFNTLQEYEQDLGAQGFPPLLPAALAGDYAELHRQCLAFDRRLQDFLLENGADLNTLPDFASLETFLKNYTAPVG